MLARSPSASVEEEPTALRAALVPRVGGGVTGQKRPTVLETQLLGHLPNEPLVASTPGEGSHRTTKSFSKDLGSGVYLTV